MRGIVFLFATFTLTHSPAFANCVPGKIDSFEGKFRSFKTGYFPDSSEMEGGFVDRAGKPLRTLQNYVRGKDKYVSVAMDHEDDRFPYGTLLRIPEIEEHYGKCIIFKVVDTGGRFVGKGEKKIDICNESEEDTYSRLTNGWSEIYVVDPDVFKEGTELSTKKSDQPQTPTAPPVAPPSSEPNKPSTPPTPPPAKKPKEPIPPWIFD